MNRKNVGPIVSVRRIILPQVFRRAIPPLGNQFIILLKESALVAYIGMTDLWSTTLAIAGANYRPLETYIVTGVFYLMEKRMRHVIKK